MVSIFPTVIPPTPRSLLIPPRLGPMAGRRQPPGLHLHAALLIIVSCSLRGGVWGSTPARLSQGRKLGSVEFYTPAESSQWASYYSPYALPGYGSKLTAAIMLLHSLHC